MNKRKLIAGFVTVAAVIAIFCGIMSMNPGAGSGKADEQSNVTQSGLTNTETDADENAEGNTGLSDPSGSESGENIMNGTEESAPGTSGSEQENGSEQGTDSDSNISVEDEISQERLEYENNEKAQLVEYIKTHDTINFTMVKTIMEYGEESFFDRQMCLYSDVYFADHIIESTINGNLQEDENGYYTTLEEEIGISTGDYTGTYELFNAVADEFGLTTDLSTYHIDDNLTEDERSWVEGNQSVTVYTSNVSCPAYEEFISELGDVEILSTTSRFIVEKNKEGIAPADITLSITYCKPDGVQGSAIKSILIGSYNKGLDGDCTCVDLRVDPDCDVIGCDPTCEIIDICQE